MYKVFNQHRAIIFTESLTFCKLSDEDYLHSLKEVGEVMSVYQMFINGGEYQRLIFLVSANMQVYIDKFNTMFSIVEAAGGLIKSPAGNLLMIYRFAKWDLPKGKVEKNEAIKDAAIRECFEETGLKNISIVKELESTYHIYHVNNESFLKRTYWFEMKAENESELTPQIEEGIEKAKWLDRAGVIQATKNTYDSLMDLLINNYLT